MTCTPPALVRMIKLGVKISLFLVLGSNRVADKNIGTNRFWLTPLILLVAGGGFEPPTFGL